MGDQDRCCQYVHSPLSTALWCSQYEYTKTELNVIKTEMILVDMSHENIHFKIAVFDFYDFKLYRNRSLHLQINEQNVKISVWVPEYGSLKHELCLGNHHFDRRSLCIRVFIVFSYFFQKSTYNSL